MERFCKSVDFRKVVDAESGKATPHVVDCCREFFKDDLPRSKDEFGRYFMEWNQWMALKKKKASSTASPSLKNV